MRRADAWGVDKDDSTFKEGRRVSKLDRRDLLPVSWIAGFCYEAGQGFDTNLLPRACGVMDSRLWNRAIFDFRDDGGHGENPGGQNFGA